MQIQIPGGLQPGDLMTVKYVFSFSIIVNYATLSKVPGSDSCCAHACLRGGDIESY
jgi:hypothetical protein